MAPSQGRHSGATACRRGESSCTGTWQQHFQTSWACSPGVCWPPSKSLRSCGARGSPRAHAKRCPGGGEPRGNRCGRGAAEVTGTGGTGGRPREPGLCGQSSGGQAESPHLEVTVQTAAPLSHVQFRGSAFQLQSPSASGPSWPGGTCSSGFAKLQETPRPGMGREPLHWAPSCCPAGSGAGMQGWCVCGHWNGASWDLPTPGSSSTL